MKLAVEAAVLLALAVLAFYGVARTAGWRIGRLSWPAAGALGKDGGCYRCRTSWLFVKRHVTPYEPGRGVACLCEKCWAGLTPEQRYIWYGRFLVDWTDALERQGRLEEVDRIKRSATSIVAALRSGM